MIEKYKITNEEEFITMNIPTGLKRSNFLTDVLIPLSIASFTKCWRKIENGQLVNIFFGSKSDVEFAVKTYYYIKDYVESEVVKYKELDNTLTILEVNIFRRQLISEIVDCLYSMNDDIEKFENEVFHIKYTKLQEEFKKLGISLVSSKSRTNILFSSNIINKKSFNRQVRLNSIL